MNDTMIVTVFVVIDDVMRALGHRTHPLAGASDAEVLTVATIAACQFQNHHERALCVMRGMGYLSGPLSLSRFNRRVHRLADWFAVLLDLLGEAFATGEAFALDSLPLPLCRRARAGRCRKVRGRDFCGWCAAKRERFFGWRLHLVVTPQGVPVAFDLLPARLHDLTPVHELVAGIPEGARVYGDKAYNSAPDERTVLAESGVRLVPVRRANMAPNPVDERVGLRRYRAVVEGVNSQLTAWGIQRLPARTNEGVLVKVFASLFALLCANAD
jgi:DDE family transposase